MTKYKINAELLTNKCVEWIRQWFEDNGDGCNAIIGMSGGKDSTVAAALCAKALGKERVFGIAMPDEGQGINDADKICEELGINFESISIAGIVSAYQAAFGNRLIWDTPSKSTETKFSVQSQQNLPPRVRTTMLMAFAQTHNGRVINTCNISETMIGYVTLFGDDLGSCSPLGNLTVQEVKAIGHYLGISEKYVEKIPDDGLPHSCSDEEKFGFTYAELDSYIREGKCSEETKEKVDRMMENSHFKRTIVRVPAFFPSSEWLYSEEKYVS